MQDLKKLLKTSRDALAQIPGPAGRPAIGEGTLVRFAAFVLHARNSNKGAGEAVNCDLPAPEENDIHIELVADANEDDACNAVTAEMSPHFRPEAWDGLVETELKRPVRITGPLFYDGLHHKQCHDDVRPKPVRSSVWEVHPVYQFDVCKAKTLDACDAGNDSAWIPFDQWANAGEDEER